MIQLKRYLPYVLIAVAFLFGQLSVPRTDKELIRKFAQEKKVLLTEIEYLRVSMGIRDEAGLRLRQKVTQDSLKYSIVLARNKTEIDKLKQKINATNFKNATTDQLDSIRHQLLRARN
jgi:hypothetical protein